MAASPCAPEATPRPTPTERPAPGGTIRLGYPEEPLSLSPVRATSAAPRDILRAVLPSFFLVTPDLRYRPYLLAEDPEVREAAGGVEVAFRIREDAVWSDGRPITVEDVRFTWEVMRDRSVPRAVGEGFDRVVGVREESPKSGVLVLSGPYAGWPDLFSAGRFVLPSHVGSAADVAGWRQGPPVSGGPFRVGRWVAGRSVMLLINPRFFGPRPLARRIEVSFVPDATTAVQLLADGVLDAVAPMQGVSWGRRLAAIPGASVSGAYGPSLVLMAVNPQRLAEGIRRRIIDAVDRRRFADAILREVEGRRIDAVLAPEQEGGVPAWEDVGVDAPRPVGTQRELSLVWPRGEQLDLLARYVQAELERVGVDLELVGLDADVYRRSFFRQGEFDLTLVEVRGGPRPWLARWFGRGGEVLPGYRDRSLARLLRRAENGGPDAGEALAEAQARLAAEAVVLPMFQPLVTAGWRAGVAGLEANPSADGILWNCWEWSKASGAGSRTGTTTPGARTPEGATPEAA